MTKDEFIKLKRGDMILEFEEQLLYLHNIDSKTYQVWYDDHLYEPSGVSALSDNLDVSLVTDLFQSYGPELDDV